MLRSRIFRTSILIVITLSSVNPIVAAAPITAETSSSSWTDQMTAWIGEIAGRVGRIMDSALWSGFSPKPVDDNTSQFLVETSEDDPDDEGEVLPGVDPLG